MHLIQLERPARREIWYRCYFRGHCVHEEKRSQKSKHEIQQEVADCWAHGDINKIFVLDQPSEPVRDRGALCN